MKKAAIILMGICLCLSIPVAAEAAQTSTSSVTQQSTINTTVPDTHMVTIRSEHAQVSYQHEEGDDEETQETVTYAVERFSSPQFQIQPKKRMEDHRSAGKRRGCDGSAERRDADTSGSL